MIDQSTILYFIIALKGQCFSLQGVIHVNFGKKNETSTIKSQQLGSNRLYQDSCNFENRILHQFKKFAGINLDVR